MYPEGWLIDPKGKTLLLFQKDPTTKRTSGYIDKWTANNGSPTVLKSRKKASATQAVTRWIELTEDGWRRVDMQFEVQAA